jgi:hypothetical protein
MKKLLIPLLVLLPLAAGAGEVDPATLYELSTEGSSSTVKVGEKGKLVIEIRPREGAHVSEEAPLKIELTGKQVTPEKGKLTLADAKDKKLPRFEVPFSATSAGKGAVDAKVTFFICTEKLCARQQKQLSVPVEAL